MDPRLIAAYADELVRLTDGNALATPISERVPGFSVEDGYAVAKAVLDRRRAAGWRVAGRKVGFTNSTILARYGVYEPIFGYMYESTVSYADGDRATLSLDGLAQPLIEPEIVFHLRETPPATDDPRALLAAVDWMAHGFEIVQCHFPEWKFTAADTVADGGLHGRYVVGMPRPVETSNAGALIEQLGTFRCSLFKEAALAVEGGGELVLGNPVNALARLIQILASLPAHPPLAAGELVTTGTLVTSLPVAPGETWSTRIEGLPLPGLEVRFE